MQLSDTEKDVLAAVSYGLFPDGEVPQRRASWAEIEKELAAQTVKFLPADGIEHFGLSEEEKTRYTLSFSDNLRCFHRILQEQDRLAELLGDIPFAVLKGNGAAMYYPRPELRQMGDIDILVNPENLEKAAAALEKGNYARGEGNGRHLPFDAPSGIHVELHQWFSSSDSPEQNGVLDGMLYAGLENREEHLVCGHRVPVLPRLENGLVLLGHINQHLSSGLGLRQIADWMMYVKDGLDEAFWSSAFAGAAGAIGMKTLAEVTTLMCKKYLGLPGAAWCEEADEGLADELMRYILDKGNFGRKNDRGSRDTVAVMHHFHSIRAAFRYLTDAGTVHWEAARKHKFLRPFAWIYQIGHIIKKGLQRKVRISKFFGEARQSRYETDLLERLRVTRK